MCARTSGPSSGTASITSCRSGTSRASHLRYAATPRREGLDVVAAVTDEGAAADDTYDVALRIDADGALVGRCSRCAAMFGPCVHVGVVAVDLACSTPMREALL